MKSAIVEQQSGQRGHLAWWLALLFATAALIAIAASQYF